MNLLKTIAKFVAVAILTQLAIGCCKHNKLEPDYENRRVLLFYECGFNNLTSYLKDNVDGTEKGLPAGYIPGEYGDVLLVYSRFAKSSYNYNPTESHLRRLYKKANGTIVSDTLKTFDKETVAASSSTLRQVLNFVKDEFPAKGYGLVFSSHGSGWLPAGYFSSPSEFEKEHKGELQTSAQSRGISKAEIKVPRRLPVPDGRLEDVDKYYGMTRSIGQDVISSTYYYGHEMDINEFADGIPYHLDYILFDMCYTSGVEVAYGLKDKADVLGLSPTEVLGDGMFNYTKLTTFLLKEKEPDFEALFKDSFEMYNKQSGFYKSSTVNVIRTNGLDKLAEVCTRMIKEYADTLSNAPASEIQGYYRNGRHYFYDLVDIFDKCGADKNDIKELNAAIDACVIYKNSTPQFLEEFEITNYSGFSMYLPCAGTDLLDFYYKKEAWNKATGLVK